MTNRSLLLAILICAPACQGGDLSVGGDPDLEREDVEGLPAGDAIGDDVSGAYLFTAFDQRSCSCRAGDEAELCPTTLTSAGVMLEQDDGALVMRALDDAMVDAGITLRGGIDADGSLLVGGVNAATDFLGDPVGDTFNRVEGNVQPRDGGSLTWTTRSRAVLDGNSIDCSMVFDLRLSWWDPEETTSCSGPDDCHPERPYCVEGTCSAGDVGQACRFPDDCASDICVDDVCSAGEPGDACTFPSDCLSGGCVGGTCTAAQDCDATGCGPDQRCFEGSCQNGAEGDPCASELHCATVNKCVEGTCYDGSEGDPCGSSTDCGMGSLICFEGACQDGSEGDGCESIAECSTDAPVCFGGACQDGSAGDPCGSGIDCDAFEGLDCLPSGVCG